MTADKQSLRQQILAQIDRCAELAYGAGHHFAQHGKHAPSSVMAQADADAKLIRLIEDYAAALSPSDGKTQAGDATNAADGVDTCGEVTRPVAERQEVSIVLLPTSTRPAKSEPWEQCAALLLNPCDGFHLVYAHFDGDGEFDRFSDFASSEPYADDFYVAWALLPDELPLIHHFDPKRLPPIQTTVHYWPHGDKPGFYTSVNETEPMRPFEATHWKPLDGASAAGGEAVARSEASAWWTLVMGAAASIEDAANCLRDPDAKKQADGAAKHYREAAQKLMAGDATNAADGVQVPDGAKHGND